ncbi:MAG: glycosyl transferase [Oscillatoriales cyanobacterium RM1_1_9]|nr:glycosyl transferase [Oscillatoriales cyanobacterium SM2_3_0]NJO45678.1 glycosyl transferase [Oscillatoriales cyanobacterium RM2_1_1]NJO70528.1 glycosyl transferase [Oscillatoriales cyanobacterium RM1_1_9]
MFYCQHILGMGHLVRSIEIVRGLLPEFQVCFINGGQVIDAFQFPEEVEVVNIPAVKTDAEFQELSPVDPNLSMEEIQETRKETLLNIFNKIQPDILIIELFPFGRRRFSFELIPLLEQAKAAGTKIVSSLRDIIVTKQDQQRHEEKICRLMNQYFDLLLIHGDPRFITLDLSFSRIQDLDCDVYYTGYVTQQLSSSKIYQRRPSSTQPTILVSVGGGRFGHELLECVVQTAPILKDKIPHHIQMFAGPFSPDSFFQELQDAAKGQTNITVERYTSEFVSYMKRSDLSISMSGYNTTMNILSTGIKAMMLPFQGNGDLEQLTRVKKLEELSRVKMIQPEDLDPYQFAEKIIGYLEENSISLDINLDGVTNTALYLQEFVSCQS